MRIILKLPADQKQRKTEDIYCKKKQYKKKKKHIKAVNLSSTYKNIPLFFITV